MGFKIKLISSIFGSLVLASCYIYQKPKLYIYNYKTGEHQNLNIGGFYRIDSLSSERLYFYTDGTVISVNKGALNQSTLDKEMSSGNIYGEYGVYSIFNDTLRMEFWKANSTSEAPIIYKKSILNTALIINNELHFIEVINGRKKIEFKKPFVYKFNQSSIKPKLYPNWIKEKKKWNK